jgi:2-polyprenyl-6-methoxyphenol hydroxylase-like FAD-dependent oxidoreductase
MEIFRQWGLEEDIEAAGLPRAETEFFYLGETLLAPSFQRFDRTELGRTTSASPTERLICAQDLVEAVLLDHARRLQTDIRFSTALVDVVEDDERLKAIVEDRQSGERHVVDADYMVAADGSRSAIRELLGIGASGPGVVGHSVSILIEADLADLVADRLAIIYKVARPHPSAFFAVVDNDRRWLMMMARDPETEPPESFTDERCLELVRAALGDDSVSVRLLGHRFFEPTALVADRFQSRRIFLAGDAAHLTTPFGALGMNCGIADAHNLAWKLAAVLQGWGGPRLLESYEAERRPVAQATTEASVLRQDVSTGPPRAAFDGITLGYAYSSGVIVEDGTQAPDQADPIHDYGPTARPGHRAPHVWLDTGGERCSTLDLFGDAFVLLGDAAARVALDSAGPVAAQLSVPLHVHAVGRDGDYIDPNEDWRETYGVRERGMVLVRPDGHVAWRSHEEPADLTQQLAHALAIATAQNTGQGLKGDS